MRKFLIILLFVLSLLVLRYSYSDDCLVCQGTTDPWGTCWVKMKAPNSCNDIDWYDFYGSGAVHVRKCGIKVSHDPHLTLSGCWGYLCTFCPSTEAMWKAIGCNGWPSETFSDGEVCKVWYYDSIFGWKWREGVWDPDNNYCIITSGNPPTNGCVDLSYIIDGIDSGGILPKVFENNRDQIADLCGGTSIGDGKCEAACGADPRCDEKIVWGECGNNGKCTDTCKCCEPSETDNGRDYFKKGTTKGIVNFVYFNGRYYSDCFTETDYCINSTHLVEYYLSYGYIFDETFDCRSLGNYGCFDGVCFRVSLSFDNSVVCTNQQVTATISIRGFTSSMQGKTAYVLNISSDKINEINSCISYRCILFGDCDYAFTSCLEPYKVCTCIIGSTGSCSCNFNAPSKPGTYSYTAVVDVNGNYLINDGEYDTQTLTARDCAGCSLSLSLSPSPACTNQQVTATVSGTCSDYNDKEAYVINISCKDFTACIYKCLEGRPSYDICLEECFGKYGVSYCRISSLTCSCNFNAPNTPGTYTYYACVDINNDRDFWDAGEFANATLEVKNCTCYKTCNTDDDCKGDFEKTCCQNGLAAYCNPGTKTCECFGSCIANTMCQEGYCCLRSISRDLPRECVPRWNITNYQGKSYLCDPIIWKNEENLKNENNKNLIEIIIEKIRSLFQPLSTFVSHFK